jgi:hypothetical protein
MSEATLESIAADLADIKTKLSEFYSANSPTMSKQDARQELYDVQQRIQMLTQERFMLQQLFREGRSKEDAIAYYKRMLNGEKPWLDPDANWKEKI